MNAAHQVAQQKRVVGLDRGVELAGKALFGVEGAHFHLASFRLFCSKWAFSFAKRTSRWRFERGMWAASTKPRQASLAAFMNKPERGWGAGNAISYMGAIPVG
jgi:hypothetical protein